MFYVGISDECQLSVIKTTVSCQITEIAERERERAKLKITKENFLLDW